MATLLRRLYDAALRHRVTLCLSLGLLIFLPSLSGGFYLDDLWHQALLDAWEKGLDRSSVFELCQKLWSSDSGLPDRSYLQPGAPYALAWFADPDTGVRFFRPLSGLALLLNHRFGGSTPASYHAVSLALWLLLVAAVLELQRRLLPATRNRPALLLAGLFFVLDDAHVYNVAWISARHGLLAVLLSVSCLLLYDRFRQHGGLHRYLLALAALVLALGASEVGMATALWIAAYEIFLARDPVRGRIVHAAPFAVLVLGFLVFYTATGHGAFGSSWYLDPFDQPGAFFEAAITRRLPGFLMSALTPIPGELLQVSPVTLWLLGLAVVPIAAAVLLPALKRRPEMRFLGAAVLGTMVVLCGVPPFSYKLLLPTAGLSFLLAVGVTDTVQRLRTAPPGRLRVIGLWAAVGFTLLTHAVAAPLIAVSALRNFVHSSEIASRHAVWKSIEWPQDRESSDVYLLNSPGTWTSPFLPYEDFYFTGRWVRDYVPFSFQGVDFDMTRLDARTLRLTSREGFLSGYFAQSLAALVRRDPRMRPGEDHHRDGFTVVVEEVRNGVPTGLLVRFPRSLDDPSVFLLAFDGDRTRRIRPPRLGATVSWRIHRR